MGIPNGATAIHPQPVTVSGTISVFCLGCVDRRTGESPWSSTAPIIHPVLSLHIVGVVDCHVATVTGIDALQHPQHKFNPPPVSDTPSMLLVRHPVTCAHPDRLLLLFFFICYVCLHLSLPHCSSTTIFTV